VLLLAEAMEAIAAEPALLAAVGAAPRLAVAKFLSPVRPGARLAVRVIRVAAGVDFRIVDAEAPERVCAEGRFALAGDSAQ
jgi:acyl dehydratase